MAASSGGPSLGVVHPFRAAVEDRGVDGALDVLADAVVFRSPVVFRTYRGRPAVEPLLRAVAQAFDDFRYEREIGGPEERDHALLFSARIGDRELEGCNFVHSDDSGRVEELVMMIRPLSAALELAAAIKTELLVAGTR